jgi:dTMP kinase
MKPFIALEGVDGSGKTTVAEQLAQKVSALYLRTPGEGYKPARKYVDNGTPPAAKLFFYLSSVADASSQITKARAIQPVVCDRYLWSTLIPHSAYHNTDLKALEKVLKFATDTFEVPSNTVLLQVNEEEQLRRLGLRNGERTASDTYCLQEKSRRKVRQLYEEVAEREGWIVVNTDNKGIDAVLNEVLHRTGLV